MYKDQPTSQVLSDSYDRCMNEKSPMLVEISNYLEGFISSSNRLDEELSSFIVRTKGAVLQGNPGQVYSESLVSGSLGAIYGQINRLNSIYISLYDKINQLKTIA